MTKSTALESLEFDPGWKMGKRAKKQAPARGKQKLAKRFKCPFCANGEPSSSFEFVR